MICSVVWVFFVLLPPAIFAFMFIRAVKKKNGPTGKTFTQFSLVQNSRVNGVVKQRNILYLGSDEALLDEAVKKNVLFILKVKIFGQEN